MSASRCVGPRLMPTREQQRRGQDYYTAAGAVLRILLPEGVLRDCRAQHQYQDSLERDKGAATRDADGRDEQAAEGHW